MDYLTKWPEAKAIQRANVKSVAKFVHQDLICQYRCPKKLLSDQETHFQDTTQATPFELVYSRTATLPVEIEVKTYPTEPITEKNFQRTLLKRTYNLMETLENKQQKAADNIQKSQEKQKKRHNNQLLDKPVEFKIENKVLLYYTKMKKQ
ncbi:hypothetical protein G9A89_010005 [Geosiphon pyriformis]|nr:hypothetical protein G9A89_010005 [Geosiphon pyriformis]